MLREKKKCNPYYILSSRPLNNSRHFNWICLCSVLCHLMQELNFIFSKDIVFSGISTLVYEER